MRAPARHAVLAAVVVVLLAAPFASSSSAAGASGPPASTTGRLLATVTDDFAGGETATHLAVRPDGGGTGRVVPLVGLDPDEVTALVGRRVTVRGRAALDGAIRADAAGVDAAPEASSPAGPQVAPALAAATSAGPRRLTVLAVAVRFSDDPSASVASASTLTDSLFGGSSSVRAYYADASDGLWSMSGRAVGPYPMNARRSSTCTLDDWYSWAAAAETAARAHGVEPDDYDHLMVVLPWSSTTPCGSVAGLGQVPGGLTWIRQSSLRVLAHELGHNVGAGHASTMRCSTGSGVVPIGTPGQCAVASTYGDPFSVMGATTRLHHAPNRQQMRLLAAKTLDGGEARTVRIVPADTTSGIREVRVDRGNGSWLAAEYRRPTGVFDDFTPGEPVVTGVTLRIETGLTDDTFLVDAHPGTTSAADAPLQVGESVSDPVSGSRVTLDAADAAGATLTISSDVAVADLTVTRAGSRATAWWDAPVGLGPDVTYELAVDGGPPTAVSGTRWTGTVGTGRHTIGVRAVSGGTRHPWSTRSLLVRGAR